MHCCLQTPPAFANEAAVSQKSHLSHPSTQCVTSISVRLGNYPQGQVDGWLLIPHSICTNFNHLLIFYCVWLALQTSACLTCSSVHSEANKTHPTNSKLLGLYDFLQNNVGNSFWNIDFVVGRKGAHCSQTTLWSVTEVHVKETHSSCIRLAQKNGWSFWSTSNSCSKE